MAYHQHNSPIWSLSSLRSRLLFLSITVMIIVTIIFYIPPPASYYTNRDTVVCNAAGKAKSPSSCHYTIHHEQPHEQPHKQHHKPKELSQIKSKYAFATFLSSKEDATISDPYFIAARTLTYQLLHANTTRSRDPNIPLIVLCTDKVPLVLRQRLQRDGAVVVVGESITSDWATTEVNQWQGILTKLRLWELTQFERIALVDSDTILTQPLDGIFHDPAVALQETNFNATTQAKDGDDDDDDDTKESAIQPDEHPLPPTYALAALPEMNRTHGFPPSAANHDYYLDSNYFNAGFFVLKPDRDMLAYYLSVLSIRDRFDPHMQEQSLLNYAHRRDGCMKWMSLDSMWNIHYPKQEDVEGGVKSIHDKWWGPEEDERLAPLMLEWRWRMEGFFEMWDRLNGDD